MIELIDDLPGKILAIRTTGLVSGNDYRTVVAPAAEARRAEYGTLRLLLHVPPAFRKFTTTALWDNEHIGLHRLRDFERIAVVTDVDWLAKLANGLTPSGTSRIRVFPHAAFDEARDWVCA